MLSMDKEAIKELTEMEAVPICNILGSLLGRSVKMSVSKVEETDMGSLAEGLPHFNVAIESRKAVGGMSADQLYIFAKEDMIRLTNYIMGVPVDAQSPLDEIALSTLKEVASQCVGAACRLPRYLTKPRQRRNEWDMAGSDGISRVSAVFRGKSLLTNKMRII